MTIGIVGTSHLTQIEEDSAARLIHNIIEDAYFQNRKIVTGDANGIDALVRKVVPKDWLIVFNAASNQWEGKDGFKVRNIRIAEEADYIYCLTTKVKKERCYHCDADHERTGGCWTKGYAVATLGKGGRTMVV